MNSMNIFATCPRVAVFFGAKVPSPIPFITPACWSAVTAADAAAEMFQLSVKLCAAFVLGRFMPYLET